MKVVLLFCLDSKIVYSFCYIDDTNLLVIIIDTNPFAWNESSNAAVPLSLDTALSQILTFINAHLALKHNNKVVVIASHVGYRFVSIAVIVVYFFSYLFIYLFLS